MVAQTANFFDATGPFIKHHWGLSRDKIDRQFDQIFNVGDTKESYFDVREYGGFGVLAEKDENAAVVQADMVQGVGKRFSVKTYAQGCQLSHELVKDVKYREIITCAQKMGTATEQTPEYIAALYLDRAFNSSYKVIGDGLELCSTAHKLPKGGTFSNEADPAAALSESAIEDIMVALRTQVGTDGLIKPRKLKALVVPSALYPEATKLAITKQKVGSANNDQSIVAGTKIVTFDYLGSNTRWFAVTDINDGEEGLFWKYRERPQFVEENVASTMSRLYIAFFRAVIGVTDPRCIFGSAAS